MQSENENFPVSWQLEGKNEFDNWILIDKREKIEEMKKKDKLIVFTLQKEMLISSLRFTILESTNRSYCYLKSFELFGEITHNDSTLQELLTKPIKRDIVTPITFNFSITSSLGLFHFFQQFSMKERSDVFEVYCDYTKPNSTSQNLLFWNDEELQTKNKYSVYLYIQFRFPFIFKLAGYRFRSGKSKFLKNWKVFGIESDHGKSVWKETDLDHQKENRDLARSGAEKSFKINCEKFVDQINFILMKNSEGRKEFNLAGLELFGILTKV
jgi:hypothetical protein